MGVHPGRTSPGQQPPGPWHDLPPKIRTHSVSPTPPVSSARAPLPARVTHPAPPAHPHKRPLGARSSSPVPLAAIVRGKSLRTASQPPAASLSRPRGRGGEGGGALHARDRRHSRRAGHPGRERPPAAVRGQRRLQRLKPRSARPLGSPGRRRSITLTSAARDAPVSRVRTGLSGWWPGSPPRTKRPRPGAPSLPGGFPSARPPARTLRQGPARGTKLPRPRSRVHPQGRCLCCKRKGYHPLLDHPRRHLPTSRVGVPGAGQIRTAAGWATLQAD